VRFHPYDRPAHPPRPMSAHRPSPTSTSAPARDAPTTRNSRTTRRTPPTPAADYKTTPVRSIQPEVDRHRESPTAAPADAPQTTPSTAHQFARHSDAQPPHRITPCAMIRPRRPLTAVSKAPRPAPPTGSPTPSSRRIDRTMQHPGRPDDVRV